MQLPSMIKGWYNPKASPERLLTNYMATGKNKYLSLLVAQFNLSLYHYLLSQSNKELAEDVVQTTWLKVMKITKHSDSGISQQTNVKSWLFTIARNTLIDEFRRQKKWQSQLLDENKMLTASLEKSIQASSRLTQFNAALAQLPFLQREAFIFQQEGFSVLEISALTDDSFETIKSRLRYARNNLSHLLGTPS
ncbi:sigma-70 family RNA polymerase sigma factor [Colwellia sp. Arc7-635]|uniref:sigma-70 family RNA polymerase sigma factor n=1 Tax=Colwellia sp. Arc7-635 TaxID=2497879 RepID=UPI001F493834|nr:sigma-70 family RNA polymerase sigma factor [Colwellia sp. Arc7-635]